MREKERYALPHVVVYVEYVVYVGHPYVELQLSAGGGTPGVGASIRQARRGDKGSVHRAEVRTPGIEAALKPACICDMQRTERAQCLHEDKKRAGENLSPWPWR